MIFERLARGFAEQLPYRSVVTMSEPYVAVPRAATNGVSLPALLTYALALPRPISQCDALFVPYGLGEYNRITHARDVWQRGVANHLLVAGCHVKDYGAFEMSTKTLVMRFGLTRTYNVHTQTYALHTRDQTDWGAAQCKKHGDITSIALMCPSYHMLRQLLTMHASLRRVGLRIPVIPVPLHLPPSSLAPATIAGETDLTGISMVDSELDRIKRYQKKGDVATEQEYLDYLEWLWKQPIIQNSQYC